LHSLAQSDSVSSSSNSDDDDDDIIIIMQFIKTEKLKGLH